MTDGWHKSWSNDWKMTPIMVKWRRFTFIYGGEMTVKWWWNYEEWRLHTNNNWQLTPIRVKWLTDDTNNGQMKEIYIHLLGWNDCEMEVKWRRMKVTHSYTNQPTRVKWLLTSDTNQYQQWSNGENMHEFKGGSNDEIWQKAFSI